MNHSRCNRYISDTSHQLSVCTLPLTLHGILGETLLLWNLLGNILGKWYTVFHIHILSVADLYKVKVIVYEKSRLNSAHLFGWLVRDLLHHLAALLPRDGGALLPCHRLALLLVNITRLRAGNLATVLTRLLDIVKIYKQTKDLRIYSTMAAFTCLGTWLQTWLLVMEHWRSVTKLVLVLGTREQNSGAQCGTAVWAPGHTGG